MVSSASGIDYRHRITIYSSAEKCEGNMATLAATENNEIVCHDDFDIVVVETDYDLTAKKDGAWWNIDNQGYLTDKVTVH